MSTAAALGYDQPIRDRLPDGFELARASGDPGEIAELADKSDSLHVAGRKLLVDLDLPDASPDAVVAAIGLLQAGGVEADVWGVHGLTRTEDLALVAAAARAGGRDGVGWVLIGGTSEAGQDVPGFLGSMPS